METVDYDFDRELTDFIIDFSDGSLNNIELKVFQEFLDSSPAVKDFAQKARNGRISVGNHYTVKAADDFEEKLARRIAAEKEAQPAELDSSF